jgi:hypothetical protein
LQKAKMHLPAFLECGCCDSNGAEGPDVDDGRGSDSGTDGDNDNGVDAILVLMMRMTMTMMLIIRNSDE